MAMLNARNLVFVALGLAPLAFAAACTSEEMNPGSMRGAADPGAPLAPSDLAAAQMGTGIHVTWKDNSADEGEFQLERKEGGGAFARIGSVVFDTVQFHDTSVAAGKTYTYRTRAVSA